MSRPNILVFLTDDHGQWASRCYGHEALHTPSLDFLAATGSRYANAFTPCPVCSPARASFWTGKIPSGHGVHDHIGNREHPGITGQETLAESLKAAGYRTGLCGKWHGHAHGDEPRPGFDFWFSQWRGTNAKFGDQPFSDNGKRIGFHGHQAPMVTDAAMRFLRESASASRAGNEEPFFLFVGYTETHSPFSTLPERLVAPHRKGPPSLPREPFDAVHGTPRTDAPEDESRYREQLAQYLASVEMIDEQVGRILDELEGQGILDETLIVYTSDHGHMNGQHGLLCKGNATVPQNFLEESIRIPLLARFPGAVQSGQVVEAFADHCDLHATLRDFAGAPANAGSPGRSLRSQLAGEPCPDWRDFQVCEYGNARMIRTADGRKLIRRGPGPNGQFADEFYRLDEDPSERENRLHDHAGEDWLRELDERMNNHFARWERPSCSGMRVGEQLRFNTAEPWWAGVES